MVTLILISLVVLFLFRGDYVEYGRFKVKNFGLALMVAAIIAIALTTMLSEILPNRQVPGDAIALYTMNRADPTLEGRMFLGSGLISEKPSYQWNYYDAEGSLVDDYAPIYDSHYEIHKFLDQSEGNAYLVIYHDDYKYQWLRAFALFPSDMGPTRYDFHLPTNAIVPEIDVQP